MNFLYFRDKIIETSEIRYCQIVAYPAKTYIEINLKENDRVLIGCDTKEEAELEMEQLSKLIKSE